MTLRCDCGKEITDWRGARGHVQFTAGDGHGEKQELPDDWKDLFTEVDGEDDEPEPEPEETEETAEEDAGDAESDAGDEDGRDTAERVKTALLYDYRALWGGDR